MRLSLRPAAAPALVGCAVAFGLTLLGHGPSQAGASPPAADPVASARLLGDAFASVAERVSAAVVAVRVESARAAMPIRLPGFSPGDSGVARGTGSGFVISRDGHILTNNHVIQEATRIDVLTRDGRRYRADVVGVDPASDLAVLKIDATGLTPLRFADSTRARVGEWVVAIGSPFGLDYTVTTGVVSGVGRGGLGANEIEDYLQTDASINPGNSGGPLVNLDGEVLGVNTMIIGRGSGISFAVPASIAQRVADQLIRTGQVRRAWLGVEFQELTPELATHLAVPQARGALIADVVPEGPAARAGIQPGDVVLAVGGQAVAGGGDLLRTVIAHDVGARLELRVLRQGRPLALTVATGERPREAAARRGGARNQQAPRQDPSDAGVSVRALDAVLRRRIGYQGAGVVVIDRVEAGSAADRAGLQPGDVVLEVNRQAVRTPDDVHGPLGAGAAMLRIERRGRSQFVAVGPLI